MSEIERPMSTGAIDGEERQPAARCMSSKGFDEFALVTLGDSSPGRVLATHPQVEGRDAKARFQLLKHFLNSAVVGKGLLLECLAMRRESPHSDTATYFCLGLELRTSCRISAGSQLVNKIIGGLRYKGWSTERISTSSSPERALHLEKIPILAMAREFRVKEGGGRLLLVTCSYNFGQRLRSRVTREEWVRACPKHGTAKRLHMAGFQRPREEYLSSWIASPLFEVMGGPKLPAPHLSICVGPEREISSAQFRRNRTGLRDRVENIEKIATTKSEVIE
ncbi:hypothetical protein B0H16DRAFT_1473705 [Mycena metata]|uniref:Uncharacterized protein n=1 Tax=Mycena metata TaxID=1033252 RepID=A0AAD7HKC6_9AGAR|nr:hypothetical protein B0H16DRAFT_1473705 [Mycena metata]